MQSLDLLRRRAFLARSSAGVGAIALGALGASQPQAASAAAASTAVWPGVIKTVHVPPKARRVIWLYMAGGMSHLDTFDYKPKLGEMTGQAMPESFTKGQQIAQLQGKPLTWFTIAGADKTFYKANAEIKGDTVIVSSPDVAKPVAVRFGWHQLAEPNLVNKADLPASPFRTDNWSDAIPASP